MRKGGHLPCGRPIPDWMEAHYSSREKRFDDLRKKLDAHVKAHALKQSASRIKILKSVANYESHFSTAQLIAKVTADDPTIGPATVYRSVPFFVSAGILRETLAKDSGERIYEVETPRHHDHIVCLDCDAILEFHEARIEEAQEKVLRKLSFRQVRHRHVIYAHCEYRKKS